MTSMARTKRIPAVAFVAAVMCLPACSRSQGRQLSSWSGELVAQGYGVATPAGFEGSRVNAAGRPVDNEFRLALSDHDQSATADPDAAEKKKLKQKRELYRVTFENGPLSSHVALAVDRRVPWRRVVNVVGYAANSGFTDIDWAFPVQSELDEPAPSKRAAVRAAATMATGSLVDLGYCHIDRNVLVDNLAGVQSLAQDAAKVLNKRYCRADMARLREVFWVMLERDKGGPMTTFHTKIARGGTTIEAPAERRFGEMVSTIVRASAHGGAVTLHVR